MVIPTATVPLPCAAIRLPVPVPVAFPVRALCMALSFSVNPPVAAAVLFKVRFVLAVSPMWKFPRGFEAVKFEVAANA